MRRMAAKACIRSWLGLRRLVAMPDVGLTTATEPLDPKYRVVIKYSVEVEGLPVYNESYDVAKITEELSADEAQVTRYWMRRLKAVVHARDQPAFSATLTHALAHGVPDEQ